MVPNAHSHQTTPESCKGGAATTLLSWRVHFQEARMPPHARELLRFFAQSHAAIFGLPLFFY